MFKFENIKITKTQFLERSVALIALTSLSMLATQSHAQPLPDLAPAQEAQSEEIDLNDVLKEIDAAIPAAQDEPVDEILQETMELNTEEDSNAADPITQVTPEAVPENADVAEPTATELVDPQDANTQAAIEQAATIPDIPSLSPENEPEDNLFFDAEALVPQSEIGRKAAPRRVSPATEPGSKLIVVKKNHSSNSKKAELVAAQRAMKLGRYESALEMYNALYTKNKRDPNILMGRAEAFQRLGQDDFAVQAYEELLDVRPKNLEARINMLGIIGQKYPAVALRQLLDLRQDNSNNVGIVAQLAVVKANLGEYNDAIRFLGIAASMEPKNPTHIFNMAVIADSAGDRIQAIQFYEQALETDTLYGKGGAIPRESIFERLAGLR